VKAFDYTALLMGAVLGDESGLRQMGNMADPWEVEVPGLLDGPGRCVILTRALPATTGWTHDPVIVLGSIAWGTTGASVN